MIANTIPYYVSKSIVFVSGGVELAGGRVKFASRSVKFVIGGRFGGQSSLCSGKASKTGGHYLHLNLTQKSNTSQPWRLDVWTVRCSAEIETHAFSVTITISATLALKIVDQASHRPPTVTSLNPTAAISDDDSSSIEVIEVLETPRPLDNDAPPGQNRPRSNNISVNRAACWTS